MPRGDRGPDRPACGTDRLPRSPEEDAIPPPLSRRTFLGSAAAALGSLALTPAALARGSDEPVTGDGRRDRPEETHGGPLALPPWAHGDASAALDAVLMFRGNPAHTFYGTGPIPDAPRILWRHRMIDFPAMYYGTPHVWAGTGWTGQAVKLGDYVFIGSQGCHLYAFEAETGKLRWRYKGGRQFKGSACLFENRLYIGNVDDWLRCIDAATGQVVWRLDTGRDLDSSPCVVDGRLYIAGENGWARCLDPRTGELRWKTFVDGLHKGRKTGSYGSETSPAVADGEYYCATYFGDVFCLDAKTGEERWKANTGDDTDGSPVIWGDHVYIAAQDGSPYAFAFERATGKQTWKVKGPGGFWSTPAVTDGVVYIASAGGRFFALDALTGKPKWEVKLGATTWSSACVVDDRVVIGATDGKLRCFDTAKGQLVWELSLGARIHSTPCIVDGRIYVGHAGGTFFAIGA